MKDEHDSRTGELLHWPPAAGARVSAAAPRSSEPAAMKLYVLEQRRREGLTSYVPVSFVANDWKVSARRVRFLLSEGRLDGRRNESGYWEVAYPYRVTEGTRGPASRRHKRTERRAE